MTENQKLALAWVNGLRRTHHLGAELTEWPANEPVRGGDITQARSQTCPVAKAIHGGAARDFLIVGLNARRDPDAPEGSGSIRIANKAVPEYVNATIDEFDAELREQHGPASTEPSPVVSEGI